MALLLFCGLTTAVIGLVGATSPTSPPVAQEPPDAEDPPAAQAPAAPTVTTGPTTTGPAPTVQYTKRTVVEEEAIPFGTRTVNDSSLPKGTTKVRTRGVVGLKKITYEVTYSDGVETGRTKLSEEVVRKPVTKVVAVGTKQPRCDPNYAGGCVPIASDVDCAGGGGNGPAYVEGPVTVIGQDIYDLDRDNDGIGCE